MAGAGFGEHLKREREMRGVSLDEIAAATRISTRFLEALELEAWDRLPGGVFNRGFVRTISRYLGLEEESLLAEYSLAKGEHPAPSKTQVLPPQPPAPKRRAPWMTLAAIPVLMALAAVGWIGWQKFSVRRAELEAASLLLPSPPLPPAAPSSLWSDSPDASAFLATVPADAEGSVPSSPVNGQDLELKIAATKDTVLSVSADGQTIFAGTLAAGQSRNLSATTSFTIDAQDAGAIRLELNGQAIAPIGPAGQPGRITLGRFNSPTREGGHD
jgi:cytoskeleton protein RodZ